MSRGKCVKSPGVFQWMTFVGRYNPLLSWLHIVSFLSQQEQLETCYFTGRILSESLVEEVCKKNTYTSIIHMNNRQSLWYHYQNSIDSKNIIFLLERIKSWAVNNTNICSTMWSQVRGGLYLLTRVILWKTPGLFTQFHRDTLTFNTFCSYLT